MWKKDRADENMILKRILKYKRNWINHLERMDNTRLPKHALNYKPRGRRDRERPRKRWQTVDVGTGQARKMMTLTKKDLKGVW